MRSEAYEKMHLHAKLTLILPLIIHEAEKDRMTPRLLLNADDRRLLLADSRHRGPVVTAGAGPPGLQVVAVQAGANLLQVLELLRHEVAGGVRRHVRVEERMNVGRHHVENGAQRRGVFLQDVDRLRGGDGAGITGFREGGLGLGDQVHQRVGGAISVEQGLVPHHDHLHATPIPARPVDDVLDLRRGISDAPVGDVNAEDELQAVRFHRRADVQEPRAVGAVEPHGRKTLGGNGGNIGGNRGLVLACPIAVIGRVGHTPL